MRKLPRSGFFPVLIFGLLGFLAMGYHPGAEDDGVYLAAVQAAVHPALYPHDAAFFELQMRTSVFDTWMAHFVRFTGMPVDWSEFLWQFASIALMIWACWTILSQLFQERSARWGGVAMFSAMLTLPVAGTALYLADQYLHPRNPATALILFAVCRILAGRRWQAVPFLLLAFVLHPLMGALGVSFCFILSVTTYLPVSEQIRASGVHISPEGAPTDSPGPEVASADVATPIAAFFPFAWLFHKPAGDFVEAIATRHFCHLYQWTWYEWLGAIGPLVIFWAVARIARKNGQRKLSRFTSAVLIYGVLQQSVALIILAPVAPVTFSTLEPMRYLQLVYIFMTLIVGAYLGKHVLGQRLYRWAIFLVLAFGGMFIAQRRLFAGTEHIELPRRASANPWLQAFAWIRNNTPQDAYFAVDSRYMAAPGEDNHVFRALAERSVLADEIKDTAVVTKAPELGAEWQRQVDAARGWKHFQLADFRRLRAQFGVSWVLVRNTHAAGLDCRYHNSELSVCQIP